LGENEVLMEKVPYTRFGPSHEVFRLPWRESKLARELRDR
jgi:hypothetical protein